MRTAPRTAEQKKIAAKRAIFICSFLLMPVLNFIIFYVYVNLESFAMAFQRTVNGELKIGFENFALFFKEFSKADSDIVLGIKNTLLTFCLTLAMFPVSFLVSFFLYKKIWGSNFFRFVFFIPSLIQGTVIAALYVMLCNNTQGAEGPLSLFVQKLLGLDQAPALLGDPRFANAFVLINIVWLTFPGDLIIWGGTFSRIPESVIESAKLDGVGWLREAAQIIVPIVWPTVALKLVLSFVSIFGAGGNVFLLTNKGSYGTQTLPNWMYLQVYNQGGYVKNSNVLNYLSAIGLMITAVTLVISLTVRYITNRMNGEVTF